MFDGSAECDEPVGAPLPSRSSVEYDRDSFYAWVYAGDSPAALGTQTLALSLLASDGSQHYVFVPLPFPISWTGWPVLLRIDVTAALLGDLDPQPTTWLLCPRLSVPSSK